MYFQTSGPGPTDDVFSLTSLMPEERKVYDLAYNNVLKVHNVESISDLYEQTKVFQQAAKAGREAVEAFRLSKTTNKSSSSVPILLGVGLLAFLLLK